MCPVIMVSVILKGVISPREAHSVKRRDLIQEKEKEKKKKKKRKRKVVLEWVEQPSNPPAHIKIIPA